MKNKRKKSTVFIEITNGKISIDKKIFWINIFHYFCIVRAGATGFDSLQSLIVSTPSIVWGLVNRNTQTTNGNNSYALAA